MDSSLPAVPHIDGYDARWVWRTDAESALTRDLTDVAAARRRGAIPTGVLIDHGDHNLLLLWAPVGGVHAAFNLDSLTPLTVVEPIDCPICGAVGWIADGEWLPAPTSSEASA